MKSKFEFFEIVRIKADVPGIPDPLIGREGLISGMGDPDEYERRVYGVHVNEYGEIFGIPEKYLESTGRLDKRSDMISRSRIQFCRSKDTKHPDDA